MAEQVIPVPLCPHCEAELPAVSLYSWQHEGWIILCVYCPDCRRVIHTQIAPMMVPAADPRLHIAH